MKLYPDLLAKPESIYPIALLIFYQVTKPGIQAWTCLSINSFKIGNYGGVHGGVHGVHIYNWRSS